MEWFGSHSPACHTSPPLYTLPLCFFVLMLSVTGTANICPSLMTACYWKRDFTREPHLLVSSNYLIIVSACRSAGSSHLQKPKLIFLTDRILCPRGSEGTFPAAAHPRQRSACPIQSHCNWGLLPHILAHLPAGGSGGYHFSPITQMNSTCTKPSPSSGVSCFLWDHAKPAQASFLSSQPSVVIKPLMSPRGLHGLMGRGSSAMEPLPTTSWGCPRLGLPPTRSSLSPGLQQLLAIKSTHRTPLSAIGISEQKREAQSVRLWRRIKISVKRDVLCTDMAKARLREN